jgi:hypothetical protein
LGSNVIKFFHYWHGKATQVKSSGVRSAPHCW